MRLGDIASAPVQTFRVGVNLLQIVRTMVEQGVGSVVLLDIVDRPETIVTETDIVASLAANKLEKSMDWFRFRPFTWEGQPDLVTAEDHMSLREAASLMDHNGIRRLPVLDEMGAMMGIVSVRDLLHALARQSREADRDGEPPPLSADPAVEEIMTPEVVTVSARAHLQTYVTRMVKERIGSLVVESEGEPVEMVTEFDVVRWLHNHGDADDMQWLWNESWARPTAWKLITASPQTRCSEAISRMDRWGIRRLPVVDEAGHMVGIVTERDLLWALQDLITA